MTDLTTNVKKWKLREHRGIFTIPEMLKESASDFGSRPVMTQRLKEGDKTITFKKLYENVMKLAQGLLALGLKPGDHCAVLGHNSPEWAMAYLAIISAGCICVPLDSLLGKNEIRKIIAETKISTAFVTPRFLDVVSETYRGFPGPKNIIVMSNGEDIPDKYITINSLKKKASKANKRLPKLKLDDVCVIIYTSGTTGLPKGVMLTHRNIVSDAAACYQAVHFDVERFLSVLPMHHTFECTAGFILPVYSGCHITFARSLKSRDILEDLKASKATVMLGVPLLFQKMLEGMYRAISKAPFTKRMAFKVMMNLVKAAEKRGNYDLGRRLFADLRKKAGLGYIRFFVVGGAPLRPDIPREFRRLGIKMLQGYGLTEASPVLTLNPEDEPVLESIGIPLPGVDVRIIEPDDDGVGELAFKGPMIMKGYYKNKKATSEILDKGGWLRTGDLGFQDKRGYLYVCGRAKNLIVTSAGKNVYPEEVEAELNKSPFILESMVYGKRVSSGGEEVRAVIVPDYETIGVEFPNKNLSDDEIHKLISKEVKNAMKQIAPYKRVKSFSIRDEEFHKTSTRKIKRYLFNKTN